MVYDNMVTTMKVQETTKQELEKYREYKNESFDEILKKLLYIADTAKHEPHLSKQAIQDIEAARKRIKKGNYYTENEARKILGV
jgi:hypothetical protein